MNLDNLTVTATNGQKFSGEDSAHMAYLVARRFGFEWEAAAAAWRRMLQNNVSDYQFEELAMAYVDLKLDKDEAALSGHGGRRRWDLLQG